MVWGLSLARASSEECPTSPWAGISKEVVLKQASEEDRMPVY